MSHYRRPDDPILAACVERRKRMIPKLDPGTWALLAAFVIIVAIAFVFIITWFLSRK